MEQSQRIESQSAEALHLRATIEMLKIQIARLKRAQFGRSSEQLGDRIAQLELLLEDLQATQGERVAPPPIEPIGKPAKVRPIRKPLPSHLPRETQVHAPACECPGCGAPMQPIGEDVAEMLEYVPARFKVIRHVRPKFTCVRCHRIVQRAAPSRPIDRGLPGPGLLAHVAVSKFADSLPLYRQSQIYAREGVDIDRSTLAGWLGATARLVRPLVYALESYVMAASKLHIDDTPLPVLQPGLGRTKTGRLWTYVRDDRPAGSKAPPAVWFKYAPDRKGERPREQLKDFHGVLQADAYAGLGALYDKDKVKNPATEAACWAHVRRHFYDLYVQNASPVAAEALVRIGDLYEIEREVRGQTPEQRKAARQARAGPLLESLQAWLMLKLTLVSKKDPLARAILYASTRWVALTRYRDDGAIEIDNNAAERSLRAVALGRKNYLFAGSDAGGDRAAAFYTLIGSAKLNGLDPQAYLRYVLERISEYPINRINELLPWNVDLAPLETLRHAA